MLNKFFLSAFSVMLLLSMHMSGMAQNKVLITIDFQTGFVGDSVELLVNDEVVFTSKEIVTDRSTGHALTIEREVMPGVHDFILLVNKERVFQQELVIQRNIFMGYGIFTDQSAYLMITNKSFFYD